jgi:uncharacterized protein
MKVHSKSFSSYSRLRKTIDKISDALSTRHSPHMQCRKGCDLCCMDYSILPVEFHYIQKQLKKSENHKSFSSKEKDGTGCIFLKENSCTIYNNRPVICRSHGLPLLFTNDDYEWELSTCELNFRQFDYTKFTPDNTFPQDKFNSKLFMLNKEFIAEFKEKEYGEFELIPLRKLAEQI